jgi:hypothetical protein
MDFGLRFSPVSVILRLGKGSGSIRSCPARIQIAAACAAVMFLNSSYRDAALTVRDET